MLKQDEEGIRHNNMTDLANKLLQSILDYVTSRDCYVWVRCYDSCNQEFNLSSAIKSSGQIKKIHHTEHQESFCQKRLSSLVVARKGFK